jgi:hypothetical protein
MGLNTTGFLGEFAVLDAKFAPRRMVTIACPLFV